jgi:hypothetical protein
MALRPEQAKALIAKVMATRDQEMTCDACVADLATFVEVQLTGTPLIQASDDYASFLRYPLVRCLMRGGGQRCGGFS